MYIHMYTFTYICMHMYKPTAKKGQSTNYNTNKQIKTKKKNTSPYGAKANSVKQSTCMLAW